MDMADNRQTHTGLAALSNAIISTPKGTATNDKK